MLSRYGIHPVGHVTTGRTSDNGRRDNADGEQAAGHREKTPSGDVHSSHKGDGQLCSACFGVPFGNEASPGYAKAWEPVLDGVADASVSFAYARSARDLRSSAENEGCLWCRIMANAIVRAKHLDGAMELLKEYNHSGSDWGSEREQGDEDDEDIEEDEDDGDEEDEREDSANTHDETLCDESTIGAKDDRIESDVGGTTMRSDPLTYDVLDMFGKCEFTVSYVYGESGYHSGFNIMEVAVDVHAFDPSDSSQNMVGENAVQVFGRLHAAVDDPAAEHVSARPCELNLGSDAAFHQAEDWLSACEKHEACSAQRGATCFHPTRVVDIGDSDKPKLYVPSREGDIFEYAALTYCWGTDQTYTTTKDTIDEKLLGLDCQSLPKTILHTLTVCRRLGFRYLWVDSLCIIQDSKEDKRHEISQMRLIFQHASLTIAAAKTGTVNDGFLSEAAPLYFMEPVKIPFQCPGNQIGAAWMSVPKFYMPRNDPWNSRAWTFEEQLLSPRLLIYSYDGLKWLCKEALWETSNPLEHERPFLELPPALSDADTFPANSEKEERKNNTRLRWFDILAEYTERSVTHEKDKLVAFAAIAEAFHIIWGGKYLAGLWQQTLFEDLLWHRDITSDFKPWLSLHPRPAKYRAPSWSWASVEGKTFGPYGDGEERSQFHFKILDCSVDLKSQQLPFGAVTAGFLEVQALLGTGYWCRSEEPADFCDGFVLRNPEDSKRKAVAKISVDALESSLVSGTQVICLPVAQITHPRAAGLPVEGFILFVTEEGFYRRVGYFSECRDFRWLGDFDHRKISIV